jgi:hypothetical protein
VKKLLLSASIAAILCSSVILKVSASDLYKSYDPLLESSNKPRFYKTGNVENVADIQSSNIAYPSKTLPVHHSQVEQPQNNEVDEFVKETVHQSVYKSAQANTMTTVSREPLKARAEINLRPGTERSLGMVELWAPLV